MARRQKQDKEPRRNPSGTPRAENGTNQGPRGKFRHGKIASPRPTKPLKEQSLAERLSADAIDLYSRVSTHWPSLRSELRDYLAANNLNPIERAWIADTVQDMVRQRRRVSVATDTAPDWGEILLEGALALRGRLDRPRVLSDKQLRAILQLHQYAPHDTVKGIADIASLPDWIAERLLFEVGKERALALALSLNQPPPQTLRVNTLKSDIQTTAKSLAQQGHPARPGQVMKSALVLESRTDVFALNAYKEGWVEMQDEGSQLIAELVAPPPRGTVIDYCAGAGGKTLALAATMQNKGRLIACDVHAKRLTELKQRLRRAGVTNHQVIKLPRDGEIELPMADRVLVDAPCTGLGVLRRHPESRWFIQPEDVAALAEQQQEVLRRAWRHVAEGGRLIYATCSLLRAENEQVALAFSAHHDDARTVLPREVMSAARLEGLEDTTRQFVRTWPDRHDCDAFFVAMWRKQSVAKTSARA